MGDTFFSQMWPLHRTVGTALFVNKIWYACFFKEQQYFEPVSVSSKAKIAYHGKLTFHLTEHATAEIRCGMAL